MTTLILGLTLLGFNNSIDDEPQVTVKKKFPDYIPITSVASAPSHFAYSRICFITTTYTLDTKEPDGVVDQKITLTMNGAPPRTDKSRHDLFPTLSTQDIITAFRMTATTYNLLQSVHTSAIASTTSDKIPGNKTQDEITHIWQKQADAAVTSVENQFTGTPVINKKDAGNVIEVAVAWPFKKTLPKSTTIQTSVIIEDGPTQQHQLISKAQVDQKTATAKFFLPRQKWYSTFIIIRGPNKEVLNFSLQDHEPLN